MNTATLRPHPLHRARLCLLHGLLLVGLALLLATRAHAQEAVPAESADATDLAVQLAAPATAAAAPRLSLPDRLSLVWHRLGQRVKKLSFGLSAALPQPAAAPASVAEWPDLPSDSRNGWELKAAPEPLVALVQMSRPTLRLSSGSEVSLRLVGGVGVMLKTQF